MARVTQEHRDARRSQILRAAAREFGAKGLNPGAATIDDIARAAGLSKGTIYTYFDDKEALLAAIIELGIENDLTLYASETEKAETAWDACVAVGRHVWDYILDPDNRELNMLSLRLLIDPHPAEVDSRAFEGPVAAIAAMLEGAQQEGAIAADLDPRVMATMILLCHHGTRGYVLRTGDTETASAVLDLLLDLVTRPANTSAVEASE